MRWEDTDDVLGGLTLVTADGLLVTRALGGASGRDVVVRGVDAVTGGVRWETPVLATAPPGTARPDPGPTDTVTAWPSGGCVADPADDRRVVCALDDRVRVPTTSRAARSVPAARVRVVALATTDGTVVEEVPDPGLPGGVDAVVRTGDLVVLAGVADAQVRVVALRPDRSVAWVVRLPTPDDRPGSPAGVAMSALGDGVAVATTGSLVLVDGTGGTRVVPREPGQPVQVGRDRLTIGPPPGAGWPTSSRVVRPDGTEREVRGSAVAGVDDGSVPDVVLTQDLLGDLHAWDDAGAELWEHGLEPGARTLVLDGRVHSSDRRGVRTLDARTGDVLWESAEIRGTAVLTTDGRVVLGLAPADPETAQEHLVALDRVDGSLVWRTALPAGSGGVEVVGGLLAALPARDTTPRRVHVLG